MLYFKYLHNQKTDGFKSGNRGGLWELAVFANVVLKDFDEKQVA